MKLKGHLLYYPEGKHDINLDNYVQKSQLNDALKSKVDSITKTTYADLKNLRDNSQLIPGSLYRITDYNCTTTQENTRSAGHQFDIVLLALSENKLAEEGWAMEHPTDVYDMTFADGVTKKCYLANERDDDLGEGPVPVCDIIDTESLLGRPNVQKDYMTIDRENKTISFIPDSIYSTDLTEENLTYNYFQNSNLSAWKVWYCLDNDKDRFTWADDSLDESSPASINIDGDEDTITLLRTQENDELISNIQYYAWGSDLYTLSTTPQVNDTIYEIAINASLGTKDMIDSGFVVKSFTPAHQGTGLPNGRGVIYRLIDEWNNDVAYDFKNIQLYLPIVEGSYVSDGDKTWVYTFCLYNGDEGTYEDGSLKITEVLVDDTYIVSNNIFMTADLDAGRRYTIPFNVSLGYYSLSDEEGFMPNNCIYGSCRFVASSGSNTYLYYCRALDFIPQSNGIYYATKKVLTES